MFPKLGLKTRIYISMLMLIMLSFLAIGFVSFYQFKSQNETYHSERLQRKEKIILENIFYLIKENSSLLLDTNLTSSDSISFFFNQKINQLSDINNLDINIFNLKGKLLTSSNPSFFENNLLASRITHNTLQKILNSNQRIVIKKDSILLTYSIIVNENNDKMAILNLPYFQNSFSDKKELNEFFITLSQVSILLFLGASFLAFILSRYITNSLKNIQEKLKSIDIKGKSPLLVWNSNDEIGALIKQYNKMVIELEKSTEKLIKSERENAWKEMAKQVAHEIKNPLTPMKLSVQLLEKSLTQENANLSVKMKNFSKTIINQIETLSSIATAFSDFASMPSFISEKVNIINLIYDTLELFKGYKISFYHNINSCVILGDKKQLIRMMNNLIANSIESIPKKRNPIINIKVIQSGEDIKLSISDNGVGIDISKQDLIFEPNFTTKTSGTGLGLAMVKNIVQSIKGKISVNSESNVGTTFLISFPLNKEKK